VRTEMLHRVGLAELLTRSRTEFAVCESCFIHHLRAE
jgi:hypothetical protein